VDGRLVIADRFEVEHLVGSGGMGEVFRAKDRLTGGPVAIKLLHHGFMRDQDVWPNPGRLGQYEAALAWSTDPARTTRWREVRVPCLVLAFEHDVDSPPRYARLAAETIPGCDYSEVADAGHIGIITHADQVARILIDFFARN